MARQAALPLSPHTPCLLMSFLISCQAGFNSPLSRCHINPVCLIDSIRVSWHLFLGTELLPHIQWEGIVLLGGAMGLEQSYFWARRGLNPLSGPPLV